MDFIKGNEQVKIDPSGIDISGAGHITIDSEKIIGDISLNGKVSITNDFDITGKTDFTGDVSLNGKTDFTGDVSLNGKTDFTGDVSLNGKTVFTGHVSLNGDIEISGNNKFVVTDTGNVGIGTSNPTSRLTIMSADSGNGNSDEFAFLSQYNTANERTGYIQKIGFYGKEEYSNASKLAASIECLYGDNRHIVDGYAGHSSSNLIFKTGDRNQGNATERMRINYDGYVGIGTTSPGYPFHVKTKQDGLVGGSHRFHQGEFGTDTTTNTTFWSFSGQPYGSAMLSIGWDGSHLNSNRHYSPMVTSNGANSVYNHVSAWFEGGVSMLYLISRSDKRFKTDISLVDDDTALNRINALESKEYHYIDPLRRQPMKTIGFIAQDVKEVIPNAVKYEINYIPDEMRIIAEPVWTQDASNNWLLDIPDLDMSGAFTGKAKFYVSNDPSGNDEVCKEVEIKSVETDDSTPLFPKTKFVAVFDQSWNNVFFYGKEVNDFHTIDKAQIFALHHSAIQELSRRNDEKTQLINMLENKVNNMTIVNAVLKSSNENLKNRLEALETIVAGLQNN